MPHLFVSTQETQGLRNDFNNGDARHHRGRTDGGCVATCATPYEKSGEFPSHSVTLSPEVTHRHAPLLTSSDRS